MQRLRTAEHRRQRLDARAVAAPGARSVDRGRSSARPSMAGSRPSSAVRARNLSGPMAGVEQARHRPSSSPSTSARSTCSTPRSRTRSRLLDSVRVRLEPDSRDHRANADRRRAANGPGHRRPRQDRIRLAVDDFGIEKSSLAELAKVPRPADQARPQPDGRGTPATRERRRSSGAASTSPMRSAPRSSPRESRRPHNEGLQSTTAAMWPRAH